LKIRQEGNPETSAKDYHCMLSRN